MGIRKSSVLPETKKPPDWVVKSGERGSTTTVLNRTKVGTKNTLLLCKKAFFSLCGLFSIGSIVVQVKIFLPRFAMLG